MPFRQRDSQKTKWPSRRFDDDYDVLKWKKLVISCLAKNTKRKVFLQRLVSTQYKASIDFCIFPCSRDKDKHKLQRVQGNDEVPFHFNVRELTAFP